MDILRSSLLLIMLLISMKTTNCVKRSQEQLCINKNESELRRVGYYNEDNLASNWIDLSGILRKQFAYITGTLNPEVSFVGSPLAALLPLGKLAIGAQHRTEQELFHLMGIQQRSHLASKFEYIVFLMKTLPGVNLDMISQVYLSKNKLELKAYSDEVKRIFGSDVQSMDTSDPKFVASNINFLVQTQTENRIEYVISARDIKPNADLIIVNAIHFHANWKYKFDKVYRRKFYGIKGEKELMFLTVVGHFQYAKSAVLKAKLIQVPFHKEEATFVICLPYYRDGLPFIQQQLKLVPRLLNTVEFDEVKVNLTMPKFKIGNHLDLGALYKKMGLKEAMHGEGIQNMSKSKVLLSKAFQKAVVEISDVGYERGALPAIIPALDQIFKPEQMVVNRPFLFFILAGKEQLFVGEFYGNGKPKKINV